MFMIKEKIVNHQTVKNMVLIVFFFSLFGLKSQIFSSFD
jgi:hypothetical protein